MALWLAMLSGTSAGQAPPINADSTEVHGIIVVVGIDKFEYGPHERPRIELILVNESDSTVTIPDNGYFCPLTFIDETWCQPDTTDCFEFSDNICALDIVRSVPPGRTRRELELLPLTWAPESGNWIHTLGRVRMWNPWGYPWPGGQPSFELSVRFSRSALVPVQSVGWGDVKRLYR
jgi:hypothetical protein